jgi:hypothetical protein
MGGLVLVRKQGQLLSFGEQDKCLGRIMDEWRSGSNSVNGMALFSPACM